MDELEPIDRAIAGLEAQRVLLGDDVVDTALQPLREKRLVVLSRQSGDQRRLVTVLFSDLVDFTVLSRALDAEDVRAVVNAYFVRWHQHIEANGGVVEKFIGDAVMAVFGLYQVREDDPHRAIRAALAMNGALEELNGEFEASRGIRLAMRVGIDTGDVVVGGLGDRPGQEFVVVGETVNRASRLQAAAPPGAILISRDTYRHVRGSFGLEPRPGLRLKGIAEPVDAHLVIGERPEGFRLDAARGVEGIETATIGRDIELRQLQDRFWDVVEDQRWRVVTVMGEAGVGKTRLLLEFDRWLAELPDTVWWFRGRASPWMQETPNALLRDVLATRLGIQDSDAPDAVREKWEQGLESALGEGVETRRKAHLIAQWLGFEVGEAAGDTPVRQEPQALRQQAQRHVAEYLRRLAADAPVVLLIEDLHWADEGSLASIDAADVALGDSRVLIVATARPTLLDRHPHWGEGLEYHVRHTLEPLSRRESRRLLSEILRRVDEVPAALTDLVVGAAEGNPFYMEELVTFLVEADVITVDDDGWQVHEDRLDLARVPPTLRGVLQARIDTLTPPERDVLQRASVIGRVFWDRAVDRLAAPEAPAEGEPSAVAALEALRAREIVLERDRSAFDETREFLFTHALLRDVTYDSVLRARRRSYHALAARWLEDTTEATSRADEYAAAIAEHYALAGDGEAAGAWYLRAGGRAMAVHALAEADGLLGRGIDLAPEQSARLRFDLYLARETVRHRLGDRAAQVSDLTVLEALAATIPDPSRQVELLMARSRWQFHDSDYDAQAQTATRAVAIARAADLDELEAEALLWQGQGLAWDGRHDEANQTLEEALAAARTVGLRRVEGEVLRYLSIVANNRSEFTRALELLDEAARIHREDQDQDGESLVLSQKAAVLFNLERFGEARALLERAIPLFAASGYRYRQAIAMSNLASIALPQGELDQAMTLILGGLELCRAIDEKEGIQTALNILGDVHRRVGDWEAATEHLTESLTSANALGFSLVASDSAMHLALLAIDRGDTSAALDLARRATALAADAESTLAVGRASYVEGRALVRAGRVDEADAALDAAAGAAAELDLRTLDLEVRAARGRAAWQAGRAEEAVAIAATLAAVEPAALEGAIDPAEIYLAAFEVLDAAHDPRAGDALEAGANFIAEFAARIGDEAMREGFVHRVPAHAAIAAARAARA